MWDLITGLVSGFSDPNLLARLIPDSAVWPHYLAIMMRSYRIVEVFYWVGLFLFLLSLAVGVIRYMVGSETLLSLGLRFALLGTLWPLTVVTPAMNGCDPKYRVTPCVLQGNWKATRIHLVEDKVEVPVLTPTGELRTKTVTVNQKPIYQISFNPTPPSGKANDSLLATHLKAAWGNFNRSSNKALFREMARHHEGIGEVKKALNKMLFSVVTASGVAGGLSSLGNFVQVIGSFLPGFWGAPVSILGGTVEKVSDASLRVVQGVGGALVGAVLFGPVALLTTYHAINTLSGAILYVILFGFPVLLGLAGFMGFGILGGTLRLILLVLLIPLITAPIFGLAMRVIYGGYQEKTEQLEKLNALAESLLAEGDPTRPFRINMGFRVSLNQIHNTYLCAKGFLKAGGRGPAGLVGVHCPSELEELFYRYGTEEWRNRFEYIKREIVKAQSQEDFIGDHFAALPAILMLPQGQDAKTRAESFVKDFEARLGIHSNPMEALTGRPQVENYISLIKTYQPTFAWSWPHYIKYLKKKVGDAGKNVQCNRQATGASSLAVLAACLDRAGNASNAILYSKVDEALKRAKEIDNKLDAGGFPKTTLGFASWGGSYLSPSLSTNINTSFHVYIGLQENKSRGALEQFLVRPQSSEGRENYYQPTDPYVAIDNTYLNLLIANSLPETIRSYVYDGMIATVLATIIAALISLLVIGTTWGLLGQLIGAAGAFAGYAAGVLSVYGGPAAISGVNLLTGAPNKSNIDMAAREAVQRVFQNPPSPPSPPPPPGGGGGPGDDAPNRGSNTKGGDSNKGQGGEQT